MKIPALRPEMAALPRGNLVYGSKLKCTIKFTPIRGVGDAAPYCGTGCSIKFFNARQGKIHVTMQASPPTNKIQVCGIQFIFLRGAMGHRAPQTILIFITHFQIYAYGGEVRFSPPTTPYLQFLISHSSFLIKIVPPSYLPTFSLRPDFALFFCPFAQEKDSHSMEKALLSFRQQGNFYNVLFSDLCRITGGSNAVRCSS